MRFNRAPMFILGLKLTVSALLCLPLSDILHKNLSESRPAAFADDLSSLAVLISALRTRLVLLAPHDQTMTMVEVVAVSLQI